MSVGELERIETQLAVTIGIAKVLNVRQSAVLQKCKINRRWGMARPDLKPVRNNHAIVLGVLGTAAIAIVITQIGAWVVQGAEFPTSIDERSAFIRNVGLLGLGLVGLPLAVWRSFLAHQQVAVSQHQLAASQLQIKALENNNVALQLQKGAELIAENQEAKASAGIATLQALATSENTMFAVAAADLLAAYIQKEYTYETDETGLMKSAFIALNQFAKTGVVSNRELQFETRETDSGPFWILAEGVKGASYRGGEFFQCNISAESGTKYEFRNVTFHYCSLIGTKVAYFRRCTFEECKIDVADEEFLNSNKFVNCDFSGCMKPKKDKVFVHIVKDAVVDAQGCFYDENDPPETPILELVGELLKPLDTEDYFLTTIDPETFEW